MNQVEELSKLVARLAHSLKKALPNSNLPDKAMDYLKRNNLQGNPLRTCGPTCRECGEQRRQEANEVARECAEQSSKVHTEPQPRPEPSPAGKTAWRVTCQFDLKVKAGIQPNAIEAEKIPQDQILRGVE